MKDPSEGVPMVPVELGRIVIREGADQQYIFLKERDGQRGFPIVIGSNEAHEIRRVVTGLQTERPLTHQLAYDSIRALGSDLRRVDIVALRNNTFYAQVVLQNKKGEVNAVVDARPSDAVALALRARCPLRVAEEVLENVRTDTSGPDPLPGPEESPGPPDPA
ncbi:MAG: bifunctional nuclease family protein [Planctomycetes bacterium]|nr:bifunctional nuclease family protein [Planctomycetota bacterium]